MLKTIITFLVFTTAAATPYLASSQTPCSENSGYVEFSSPERVQIAGYDDHAMEPFLTRDGAYLLFNNLNQSPTNTNLHYARYVDGTTFEYLGEIEGVNTEALEGVPTLDSEGHFYFVSTRSYDTTFSTIYTGQFEDGSVSEVALATEISLEIPGIVNFDVEISPDGNTLYFVDSQFSRDGMPQTADLVMAVRGAEGFKRLPNSTELLVNVNTETAWEYAAAISEDGRELFFTRFNPDQPGDGPKIFRVFRDDPEESFGCPEQVSAAVGFVEAPTFSPDEQSLYYHRLDPATARFVIYRIRR